MKLLIFFLALLFSFKSFVKEMAHYTPIKKYSSSEYNHKAFFNWYTMYKGVRFQAGDRFPNTDLYRTDKSEMIKAHSLFTGRPVVIEFGSITCAAFIQTKPAMYKLYEKYKGQVDFFTLYVRENHPTQKFPHHTQLKNKIKQARQYESFKKAPYPTLVDTIAGDTHQLFDNLPNSVLIIDGDGFLRHQIKFSEPTLTEKRIKSLLANTKSQKINYVLEDGNKDFLKTMSYRQTAATLSKTIGYEHTEVEALRQKLKQEIKSKNYKWNSPEFHKASRDAIQQLEKKLAEISN